MYRIAYTILVFVICSTSSNIRAQNITITGPAQSTTVGEGDDFATDVLANSWDFNERRDTGWEENFVGSSIKVENGIWSGINEKPGGHIFPLFPGFKASLFSEGLAGDKTLPKLGINHRIDANKYYHLSYRVNVSHRTAFAIYWEHDESKNQYWADPTSPKGASFDGFYHFSNHFSNAGFTHYSFNLKNAHSIFEQKQGSWTGRPFILRLDPSFGGQIGAKTEFDWIRLSDPNSAPNFTLNWNIQGIPNIQNAIVTVHYDTNSSGYNGTPLHRFTGGNIQNSFTFPTATLPPGTYRFYITAQFVSGGVLQAPSVYSNYSHPLIIVPKASGFITAPSMTSGSEYSKDILGKEWDMTDASDLPNLDRSLWHNDFRQLSNPMFMSTPEAHTAGTVFAAQADPPLPGNLESDVQLHLRVSKANPIETDRFRYLVYRIKIDETQFPTLHDKIELGWVMRPVWWNNEFTLHGHSSAKAHIMYEGWNTYGTDLSDPSIIEWGTPWNSQRTINNFRIDPLETPFYTWFYLDYVRLYAENRAETGFYDIKYTVSNTGGSPVTARIFHANNKEGNAKQLIGIQTSLTNGEYTYRWNTNNLTTDSSHWIFIELSNNQTSNTIKSEVHVKIGPYQRQARSIPPQFDFDGDGVSDQVVYRANHGNYFFNKSSAGYQSLNWGNRTFTPVYGDFDGDGVSDRGLVVNLSGYLHWYIIRSSDQKLYARSWGLASDKIAIADYNGNGIDELCVYRNGAWYILDENDKATVMHWGLPDIDIPVPADYDGDGKTDLAIFRKTDGMWWILYSGFEQGHSDNYYAAIQWGLPWAGDIPVPTDYSGNGKADIAVWRPSDGTWYVKNIENNAITVQQWGLPGDVPLYGHHGTGEQSKSFVVYRPSTAMWFYNLRNGQTKAVQFGLTPDLLPIKVDNR